MNWCRHKYEITVTRRDNHFWKPIPSRMPTHTFFVWTNFVMLTWDTKGSELHTRDTTMIWGHWNIIDLSLSTIVNYLSPKLPDKNQESLVDCKYELMLWLHNACCCPDELWVRPSLKRWSFLNTPSHQDTIHTTSMYSRRSVMFQDTLYPSCLQDQLCLNPRLSLGHPSHDAQRGRRKDL